MFDFDFDKAFYTFTRSTKDMMPYEIIKGEGKRTIVHNVVGLSKDDIKVEIIKENKTDYLNIFGEKKNEITNKMYSVSSRFWIDSDEIKSIDWYVKDGLLYVEVLLKESEKLNIPVSYKG